MAVAVLSKKKLKVVIVGGEERLTRPYSRIQTVQK
jgi:hypothetical protein